MFKISQLTSKHLRKQLSRSAATASRIGHNYNSGTSVWVFLESGRVKYDTINHGQGFPNWEAPEFVKEACVKAVMDNHNQYTPPVGHPPLKQQLSRVYSQLFGMDLAPTNFQVTVGAAAGIENSLEAFIDPGDEVIVFEPYFDFYKFQIAHCGGIMKTVKMREVPSPNGGTRWGFDVEELKALVTDKTKMIIVNTPQNPSGAVLQKDEIEQIADVVRNHPKMMVISDEVYEDILLGDNEHIRIGTLPGMFERTLTVSSAAKKFSVTGWKIGWVIGTEENIQAVNFVSRTHTWCQATPLQHALADIFVEADKPYKGFPNYYDWLRVEYDRKIKIMLEVMETGGLTPVAPEGSFFAVGRATELLEKMENRGLLKPFNPADPLTFPDWQLSGWLAENARLTVLPMSAFYEEDNPDRFQYMRFSFCVSDDMLKESLRRMQEVRQNPIFAD